MVKLLVADGSSTKLSDICEFIIDSEHKTAPTQDSGYPYIRTPNIGRGRILAENLRYVSEEAYIQWTRRGVPKSGDLILAREAPVGNIAIVKGKMELCLGQRTVLIRPNTKLVDPDFLTYFLLGDEVQSKFHGFSTGATVPHLNMSDIRGLKLPQLPRLHEQRIIGSILSAYDTLIENNRRLIKLLEEIAKAIYREWFVHFRFPRHEEVEMVDSELGAIPKGWNVAAFTYMTEVLSGGTPKTKIPEYWNGKVPFFTPRDIQGGFYVLDTERHITELGLNNCRSDLYPASTVFITARGTVGRVVLPAVPMALSQTSYALRGLNNIGQIFVFFKTLECVEQFKKMTHGAVFDTIIVDTFRAVQISLPPAKLIQAFCETVSPFLDLILNLIKQQSVLQLARDILLPRLVSGETNLSNFDIAIPTLNTRKTSKYENEQSTLVQQLDGDEKDGSRK